MQGRTDLAIEAENAEKAAKNEGFISKKEFGDITVTLQTSGGNDYLTLTLPPLMLFGDDLQKAEQLLCESVEKLLPEKRDFVLVVGLGNTEITPDALGPETAKRILATRHISRDLAKQLSLNGLKKVAVLSPGVLGQTGIEAAELVLSVCQKTKPDAVIVVDALCAKATSRLGSTIQLTNAGIAPGSGVKNSRAKINAEYLGVPVIAVGMPTVIDMGAKDGMAELLVTPKDIDLLIDRAATLIGNALNFCLQPEIDRDVLISLV